MTLACGCSRLGVKEIPTILEKAELSRDSCVSLRPAFVGPHAALDQCELDEAIKRDRERSEYLHHECYDLGHCGPDRYVIRCQDYGRLGVICDGGIE